MQNNDCKTRTAKRHPARAPQAGQCAVRSAYTLAMTDHALAARPPASNPLRWWRRWWRSQSAGRQDRFAMLAPLVAVLLFLLAIAVAIWYLRAEEHDREQETVKRDVEYGQQRLGMRVLERQDQLLRLARDIGNQEIDAAEFSRLAKLLVSQHPEVQAITWVDAKRRIMVNQTEPTLAPNHLPTRGPVLPPGATKGAFDLARQLQQPVYSQPVGGTSTPPLLQLYAPITQQGHFGGVVIGQYALESLLRYGIPPEVHAKYALTLLDQQGLLLAGNPLPQRTKKLLPWSIAASEYELLVPPIGPSLRFRAQAYQTSQGLIGSGLFWLVASLSALTTGLLLVTWRHTRRRLQAQQALVAETNFRRAMENSMLTGMRALDLQGRITYVNAAFCKMTGWEEAVLIGQSAPFSYWPEADHVQLSGRLADELSGQVDPSGFQVRVKRKNGSIFDARLYVSPLIDAHGRQTGWMTSMTDITEPNRIREQLSASHERFTVVLEALDASVSVAPLGSQELLFANKLYRLWFGAHTEGHLQLVAQAGRPDTSPIEATPDEDGLMGLPTDAITNAQAENAEIFVPELGKWLEVRSRYLNWVDGRIAQMVIATDITPRRHAEEQSAQQAERAQSISRLVTMGEMASSVAHELNQPLTAISNYCSGMVSRIKGQQISPQDLVGALEKTAHQAQRAGQIIQRIRAFVKRSEPNRTPSDVGAMVMEAVELVNIELRRRHVHLSHYIAARLPHLLVDPILIEQVLVNLMKNAAESIDLADRPPARRTVELRVVPKQIEGQATVEFSVTDTGHGLAMEAKGRLFEAFFSTKTEGMGMGLNLCRSIVESHHGRLRAENIYNGSDTIGCRFSFWIPLA